jgi:hypothetical protein
MKRLVVSFLLTALPLYGQGIDVTAYVTADNFYALYTGQADGSGLQLIGRNERTDSDPNGGCSWSYAETWNLRVGPGEHIYVAAWNDEYPTGTAMWIGAFQWADAELKSNFSDWECAMSAGPNPNSVGEGDTRNELPDLGALEEEIRQAEWTAPGVTMPNGGYWGLIDLVGDAEFVWFDSFFESSLHDHFFLFRTLEPIAGPAMSNQPPVIFLQPTGGQFYVGENVKLSARAVGTWPLTCQWWHGNWAVTGATNSTVTLSNVTVALTGDYYAVITNAFGSATSQVATITVTRPQSVPAPSGLVAWWTGDGNADDLWGDNHGILLNGATFTDGKVGQAFWFDGMDDQMRASTTGLPVGTSDRTMEFWFRIDEIVAGESMWVGYGYGGEQVWCIGAVGDPAQVFWSQWGSSFSGGSVVVGRWHHVAASSEGTVTTLYLDGIAVGSSSIFFDTAWGTDLTVGYLDEGRKQHGAIDELSVYSRALSALEIQGIYQAGVAGKAKPGVLLYAPVVSGDSVTISWNGGPGVKLQKTSSLANPDWQDVAGSDGVSQIILPRNEAATFFRLIQP